MSLDQSLLFALFGAILILLLWGRIRYDVVAAAGLLTAVVLGLVPESQAFSGFSNPAVLIVGFVLIASRGFENSGVLDIVTRRIENDERPVSVHIGLIGGMGAILSSIMNNVAALALLMPVDIQAARKANRPPGQTLMPLAFATILGGMVTLIGTPPNIVASAIRGQVLGAPYHMFDFTPVGLAVALAGVVFVASIGWRLVPRREDATSAFLRAGSFKAEIVVPKGSKAIGQALGDLDEEAEQADVLTLGLIRGSKRYYAHARALAIEADDLLVIEGSTDGLAAFIKVLGLQEAAHDAPAQNTDAADEPTADPAVVEVVVHNDSRLIGRSAAQMGLRTRYGVTLLGIMRAGFVRVDVRDRAIAAGDVLLTTGRRAGAGAVMETLGAFQINRISIAPIRRLRIALTVGLFALALVATAAGLISFAVALAIVVTLYALLGLVPLREFYDQVDWPVLVMLACLLPIGAAFEQAGGTALVAGAIVSITHGYSPVVALVALMVVTMTLSDVLNNVATMIVIGPVAVVMAQQLRVNPDTFLMGTAVACSCAFLTPIGHQNNTLIMAPGGFRFADYWRMGLLLEIIVLAVAVPMLLMVWPL